MKAVCGKDYILFKDMKGRDLKVLLQSMVQKT